MRQTPAPHVELLILIFLIIFGLLFFRASLRHVVESIWISVERRFLTFQKCVT